MIKKIIKTLGMCALSTLILTGCGERKIYTYRHHEVECGKAILKYFKNKDRYNLGHSIEKDGYSGYDILIFKYSNTKDNEDYKEVVIDGAPLKFVKKYFGEEFDKVKTK
ncbi:MAG: hypothetical protein IJ094_10785 [Bacilli bacterium]|nr:hypothetical protein [Bacilli bacterium]